MSARARARTRCLGVALAALGSTALLGCSTPPRTEPAAEGSPGAAPVARAGGERQAAGAGATTTATTPTTPTPAASAAPPVPAATRQLLVARVASWSASDAELSLWTRDGADQPWRAVGQPWRAVIGRGAAWGRGLHGDGPPPGQSGATKREGDGKSPAGAFALRGAYGYAAAPPEGTHWRYTAVDDSWQCIDDPASRAYGEILDVADLVGETKDWSSAEAMRRRDALYTWVVDVAHNPGKVRAGGSCIFLHVWRSASAPTVGCTAMPRPALERVLRWLDPEAQPVFVLLPQETYDELTTAWQLPSR